MTFLVKSYPCTLEEKSVACTAWRAIKDKRIFRLIFIIDRSYNIQKLKIVHICWPSYDKFALQSRGPIRGGVIISYFMLIFCRYFIFQNYQTEYFKIIKCAIPPPKLEITCITSFDIK